MSSIQDQVIPDIRLTEKEKLPAHLGEKPLEEALKDWFFDYGWVYLCKITNKSGNTVKINNPYRDRILNIAPGETEDHYSTGYYPYWKIPERYEITYYNKAFNDWKTLSIKDLEGNWWVSFAQDQVDEDIRTLRPALLYDICNINLTINESGYAIYNVDREKLTGRISFKPVITDQ